ncbi:septum formation protein Maf [Pelagibius litoralis]|uniref:Nucleoside triphosphate pyrophosphatase n=1 Tax=Pelagibius litoralis TaxID=374515 RepID=A0A967F205_9PROT|nr:Maf family nucleotide pyrophosphatase [Pelagibius litoralis]NIA71711.1 septum formation protein Maf [Pelagibius litoralis]
MSGEAPAVLNAADAPLLVLASGSATRRKVLAAAGVAFQVQAAAVDETAVKESLRAEGATAIQTAETLAELKAQRVAAKFPGALVIGADQMLSCNAVWFDKPVDSDHAAAHLRALSGKAHELSTAVCVVRNGARAWHHNAVARLTMRSLSDDFIETYLAAAGEAVLGSVGAYQLEGPGAQLFAEVEGDFFTVLGLPLLPLLDYLRANKVLPS